MKTAHRKSWAVNVWKNQLLQGPPYLSVPQGTPVCFLGRGERVGPPAHTFSIAYSLATTGRIPFKFGTCMQ